MTFSVVYIFGALIALVIFLLVSLIAIFFRAELAFRAYIKTGEIAGLGDSMMIFGGDDGHPLALVVDFGILCILSVIWAVLWPITALSIIVSMVAIVCRKIYLHNEEKKEIMDRLNGTHK